MKHTTSRVPLTLWNTYFNSLSESLFFFFITQPEERLAAGSREAQISFCVSRERERERGREREGEVTQICVWVQTLSFEEEEGWVCRPRSKTPSLTASPWLVLVGTCFGHLHTCPDNRSTSEAPYTQHVGSSSSPVRYRCIHISWIQQATDHYLGCSFGWKVSLGWSCDWGTRLWFMQLPYG